MFIIMIQRRSKRPKKKRTRMKKSSTKPIGFIYYKMDRCKYCKKFESELWGNIVEHCNKKGIQTHIYPYLKRRLIANLKNQKFLLK